MEPQLQLTILSLTYKHVSSFSTVELLISGLSPAVSGDPRAGNQLAYDR
jgi:hypothetical protein